MKIVQVMLAKGFGGAERSFVDISEELLARGHDVVAIVESRSKALSLLKGPKVYALKVRAHWDPIARYQLKKILTKEGPDLLHAHLARAAKIAGGAAYQLGIPSLVKTHNYVNLKYYQHISCLVPTTLDQERYLLSSGIPTNNICRIPNFTAMNLLDSATKKTSLYANKPLHFVTIGRLVQKKGFDILVRALSGSTQLDSFKLTIVGDGEQRENLETLVDGLGIRKYISFAGWRDHISPILDDADIFILPSLDEPFGIVLLEAMARAVPIVATKTQGPSEILDDTTAILVTPGDALALREGLEAAVRDPAATLQRATNALAICRKRYSKEIVVDRYVELYEKLLSPTDAPSHPTTR